jgi:GTP-binding protein Era
MKSGFVTIVGRPNVGKSTLLNSIMNKKVAITSDKSGTTRNIIKGIYTKDDYQMVFVDTPGIHKAQNKLGKVLNKEAYFSLDDVDVILFVVDITKPLGGGDKYIIETLKNYKTPVFLIINKIDKVSYEEILKTINDYKDLYDFKEIIPVSSLKSNNVSDVIETLKKYMTSDIMYYPEDMTDENTYEFHIAELIREKILELTKQEVPHSVMCKVDNIEEDDNVISIQASIIVDRESIKRIIVGHGGSMIKEIGIRARGDIEDYLNKKVYLELFVKVVEKWRDKDKFLNEIGYKDFN